jgi:glucose/arabinose dehydrogenase
MMLVYVGGKFGLDVNVTDECQLNHGLALSQDGRTLYASSANAVYSWDYDGAEGRNTSAPRTLVSDFGSDDGHVTRTLLLSQAVPGMLLVSRGSGPNVDPEALDKSTAISTIKAFNISNATNAGYSYINDGLLMGWGLRNSVGVAEDPASGAIYSVENSVDNIERNGELIKEDNPGEELNFHGYLNGTSTAQQGSNYGYPSCYAAWNVSAIPSNTDITVGSQFAVGNLTSPSDADSQCRNDHTPPRLTFAAHMAPLDIKFNANGTGAWVTFHGSWNRDEPQGYKVSFVPFNGAGEPTAPADSLTGTVDVVTNRDVGLCPDACIRPAGLAWDGQGRLWFSSDSTGEIYVVTAKDGSGIAGVGEIRRSGGGSEEGPESSATPTATKRSAGGKGREKGAWAVGAAVAGFML